MIRWWTLLGSCYISLMPLRNVLSMKFVNSFDENYGYPIDIYFDMDEMIADEEIGYTISNFKIN